MTVSENASRQRELLQYEEVRRVQRLFIRALCKDLIASSVLIFAFASLAALMMEIGNAGAFFRNLPRGFSMFFKLDGVTALAGLATVSVALAVAIRSAVTERDPDALTYARVSVLIGVSSLLPIAAIMAALSTAIGSSSRSGMAALIACMIAFGIMVVSADAELGLENWKTHQDRLNAEGARVRLYSLQRHRGAFPGIYRPKSKRWYAGRAVVALSIVWVAGIVAGYIAQAVVDDSLTFGQHAGVSIIGVFYIGVPIVGCFYLMMQAIITHNLTSKIVTGFYSAVSLGVSVSLLWLAGPTVLRAVFSGCLLATALLLMLAVRKLERTDSGIELERGILHTLMRQRLELRILRGEKQTSALDESIATIGKSDAEESSAE